MSPMNSPWDDWEVTFELEPLFAACPKEADALASYAWRFENQELAILLLSQVVLLMA